MFSGVSYENPPVLGKKMLGMPSALHVIQLRKNQVLLSDGMTPIS